MQSCGSEGRLGISTTSFDKTIWVRWGLDTDLVLVSFESSCFQFCHCTMAIKVLTGSQRALTVSINKRQLRSDNTWWRMSWWTFSRNIYGWVQFHVQMYGLRDHGDGIMQAHQNCAQHIFVSRLKNLIILAGRCLPASGSHSSCDLACSSTLTTIARQYVFAACFYCLLQISLFGC